MPCAIAQVFKAGDEVPPEIWSIPLQVVNHPEGRETITLADHQNKLIVLDFWATWCVPCIKSLSKLDSLQHEFGDLLSVVPVTREASEIGLPMIKKRGWSLVSVVGDSVLRKFFPHRGVPHLVWIRAGKVVAVTGPESSTRDNIKRALSGRTLEVVMKETDFEKFEMRKPLLVDGNGGGGENLLYQSIVTKVIPGANGTLINGNRILIANAPIHDLFREVYSDTILWTARHNRVMSTLCDSLNEKIFRPDYVFKSDYTSKLLAQNWMKRNTYCYSLTLPHEVSRGRSLEIGKADLNRFFGEYLGINARIENRLVKCLVVARLPDGDILIPDVDVKTLYNSDGKNTYFRFDNYPFKSFITVFEERNKYSPLPIVNESDYTGKISMEFKGPLTDLAMVREELRSNGLDLVEKEVRIDVLVFYALNNKNL